MKYSIVQVTLYKGDFYCLARTLNTLSVLIFKKSSETWHEYPSLTKVNNPDNYLTTVFTDFLKLRHATTQHGTEFPNIPEESELPNFKRELVLHSITNNAPIIGKPVVIVSASAKSNVEDTKLYKSIQKIKDTKFLYNYKVYDLEYHQIMNNKTGLSELYNCFLTEAYRNHIVIYVHDDVYIEDLFLFEKLYDAHSTFDVVGVAGSTNVTIKSPAYWHLMANRQDLRGFCSHQLGDITNMTVFGNSKLPVDLIDGVFMSANISALLDASVTFDEDFDFHFYDLAFSKRVKNAGLALGVWPMFITHFSAGGGNQRWKDLEPLFISKYE